MNASKAIIGAALLDRLPFAVVLTDIDGTILYANGASHHLYQFAPGTLAGRSVLEVLTPPPDVPWAEDIMGTVLAGRSWSGEFPVQRADGSVIRLQVTDSPVIENGEVVAVLGLAEPLPAERHESLLVDRLVALTEMLARVAAAEDLESAAEIVTGSAAATLGAESASLTLLEPSGSLRLVRLHSRTPVDLLPWRHFDVDAANAISEAVRTGKTVSATDKAEIEGRWPGVMAERFQALIALPLTVQGECIGALGLAFTEGRDFSDVDHHYLAALADSCAQTVERIRVTAAAETAARRLSFLAGASAALAESLDYESTLRRVADLAVPVLADWCAIDLVEGSSLRRVAVSHIDPSKVDMAWELQKRNPQDLNAARGAGAVARTGRSELIPVVDDSLLDRLDLDEDRRRLIAELQLHSAVTVPLTARQRTLGVLTLIYAESGREYTGADVAFAEDLAGRAALAIDNAQLHTETLQAALQLQQAVLPDSFPDSDSWRVAVHYRPAGRTEVGGDFFDALSLPDGRLVTFLGDVMGRGVAAAATMAQVRAAVRAYLADDPEPLSVVERLDTMFNRLSISQLVTLLYGVVDPGTAQLRMVNAGHLPPLLIRPDGRVHPVDAPASPPLGVALDPRVLVSVRFGPEDTLLTYTDGLIERRGEDIDEGLRRLINQAGHLAGDVSDQSLSRLADELRHAGHDDDVTVLALHAL